MIDKSTVDKKNLVWMDLEMTGLDPKKEEIIEIATVITDGDLNIVAHGPNLVIHQKLKLLKSMDAWNQKQHTKSGLIDRVKTSKITLKMAEKASLDFIMQYCPAKISPLCGSSIHHDRRFLLKSMPKLHDYFHYRNIDVSTVKALVQRWYPRNKEAPKKKDTHLALTDILESIEDLRFMRETYFKAP